MPKIVCREYSSADYDALRARGLTPLLSRLYAARGISDLREIDYELINLLPFDGLKNAGETACILADAIAQNKKLVIVADYDADGATACAVGMRALKAFGARVDYLVPNRFEYGYGLTPEIVELAARSKAPDFLITVDNGIASVEGVARANALGMSVLVTDHHLPGERLPDARAIVNPNQSGCAFASKCIAGVGVMFYVMLALRAELRKRGWFAERHSPSPSIPLPGGEGGSKHPSPPGRRGGDEGSGVGSIVPAPGRAVTIEPNLGNLLDLVALGTVADVVKLDANNRILVQQGLARIRAGRAQPGVSALFRVGARDLRKASTYDLAFVLGPRLNAAGRLTDMALGIECLITADPARAEEIARELDRLNHERRGIEAGMREDALVQLETIAEPDGYSVCLFDPQWHQGVIGILASRIKDKLHRPAIAFARGDAGELKGSGRAIRALHLRDALDLVSKRHRGLLLKFGGHAAAAGLTLREADFARFAQAFEQVSRELLSAADLDQVLETDGPLAFDELTLAAAESLEREVWGQGFSPPLFHDQFEVESQRVVGAKHLKLKLRKIPPRSPLCQRGAGGDLGTKGGTRGDLGQRGTGRDLLDAILFSHSEPLPARIGAVYRIGVNEYNGARTLQLTLENWHEVDVF